MSKASRFQPSHGNAVHHKAFRYSAYAKIFDNGRAELTGFDKS